MDGFAVQTLDEAVDKADIFVTATGNRDVITVDHMRRMKDMAIVVQHRSLRQRDRSGGPEELQVDQCQTAGRHDPFSGRQPHRPPVAGPPRQSGNATGHPSFVMSASFTNQTLARSSSTPMPAMEIRQGSLRAAEVTR